MKRIISIGALALLAACGSSGGVSVGSASPTSAPAADATSPATTPATTPVTTPGTAATSGSAAGSDDTITVDNFGDMPPKCIELLTQFLKKIEPSVSEVDWNTATLGQFESFGEQFQAESDAFDQETEAAGCNKYNLSGSDDAQIEQMKQLAQVEAPGTVGFLEFLGALTASASASSGDVPDNCADVIAAIEPFIAEGKTMRDLTMTQVTRIGQLINGVNTTCTSEESNAFFSRPDVSAFISA